MYILVSLIHLIHIHFRLQGVPSSKFLSHEYHSYIIACYIMGIYWNPILYDVMSWSPMNTIVGPYYCILYSYPNKCYTIVLSHHMLILYYLNCQMHLYPNHVVIHIVAILSYSAASCYNIL